MPKTYLSNHPLRVFAWALAALFLLLVIMEGWRHSVRPDPHDRRQRVSRALDDAAALFAEEQQNLLAETGQLAQQLKVKIEQEGSRQDLFEELQGQPRLWGGALYRGNQPVVWTNFSLDPFQEIRFSDQTGAYSTIKRENNVLIWIAHDSFVIPTGQGSQVYHLYTARRIEQTNALPIGGDREYSILDRFNEAFPGGLQVGIYDPPPDGPIDYRVLRSVEGDSLGIVYSAGSDSSLLQEEWQRLNRFWRAVFILLCFTVIGLLLYVWLDVLPVRRSLIFQVLVICVGWIVFNQVNIADVWLPPLLDHLRPERISSYQRLCNFTLDGLFFLATAFTLRRKLRTLHLQVPSTSYFTTLFAALGTALVNLLAVILTFKACFNLAYTSDIPTLTLQVYPGAGTLLFYLTLGIMILALTIALGAINLFLLQSCRNHYKLAAATTIAGYILALLVVQFYISDLLAVNWAFLISVLYFGLVFAFAALEFRSPFALPHSSPLRAAAIYTFVIALAGSTIIYQSRIQEIDKELRENIEAALDRENEETRALTQTILTKLQQQFRDLTEQDLQNRRSFIQAQFSETIEAATLNNDGLYSFDLQLIRDNQSVLADYSTNLNSPEWVEIFNLRQLKAAMAVEQISKNNARPIVQQPELADGEQYQTFYRGWLPLFGEGDEPIAWILCSVYQERADFNKPMRAVMASLNYQDWENSHMIQRYENGRLAETIYKGIGTHYPVHNLLQEAEKQALQGRTALYFTSKEHDYTYRNLLLQQADGSILKNSTLLPGYQHILFSFFRLSFTLLIAGFLILLMVQWIRHREITLFSQDERFQYRILDSFLLATLLFLILVVFVTHFAIEQQNTDLIEEQLFEKLQTITDAMERSSAIWQAPGGGTTVSLDSLTSPLNVDASFYEDRMLTASTTPQIYQQHLLPNALPYTVHNDLFVRQKRDALTTVTLDQQPLLIGYRSVLDDDRTPRAAIAIPTFVKSPKFNKQLLETTSYLIILYLVIFGLFIIGTTLISRQLTRPLDHIQEGLNKISKGNLDTTIPVTSDDEIGSLAMAYNQMVNRLKELQQELAAAEREAAWQEMAQQVAHEIKNPLTPMKLNIQHLERQLNAGDPSIEELKQQIRSITRNLIEQIQSLNAIASDFSKFSKPVDKEFTEVDVNALVYSVVDLYKHDEQIHIQTQCQAQPATVAGVKDELRRVIINLVKNAHEAMNGDGHITLRTYRQTDSLFVEVEDDGEGIREEDKSRIFVPNFSTKSSGTGLGLAICKKVVEAHEGSISFASIQGKGTTFIIKLPAQAG